MYKFLFIPVYHLMNLTHGGFTTPYSICIIKFIMTTTHTKTNEVYEGYTVPFPLPRKIMKMCVIYCHQCQHIYIATTVINCLDAELD